jgi:hypothetical protein
MDMNQEIIDLKIRVSVLENDMADVKENIKDIREDTRWVRRMITGAVVTAGVSGMIAIIVFLIQKGL